MEMLTHHLPGKVTLGYAGPFYLFSFKFTRFIQSQFTENHLGSTEWYSDTITPKLYFSVMDQFCKLSIKTNKIVQKLALPHTTFY